MLVHLAYFLATEIRAVKLIWPCKLGEWCKASPLAGSDLQTPLPSLHARSSTCSVRSRLCTACGTCPGYSRICHIWSLPSCLPAAGLGCAPAGPGPTPHAARQTGWYRCCRQHTLQTRQRAGGAMCCTDPRWARMRATCSTDPGLAGVGTPYAAQPRLCMQGWSSPCSVWVNSDHGLIQGFEKGVWTVR